MQRPEITVGDTWRFAAENRLSPGTAEESRRVLEVTPERIVCARRIGVPAGEFDVLPVRYEADVKSDDGQARLAWRNVEVMHYAAAANLYVQAEHTIVSPDGRLARDTVARLVEYRRG